MADSPSAILFFVQNNNLFYCNIDENLRCPMTYYDISTEYEDSQ